jgi:Na+/pantothenate symporter
MTNIIVTAMLLLGGSAVVNALTGMNIYAASFLIPLGVIVYTLAGGLKATFLASYIHSVIGTSVCSSLHKTSMIQSDANKTGSQCHNIIFSCEMLDLHVKIKAGVCKIILNYYEVLSHK